MTRAVAVYRTATAGQAVPAARLDTGIPILCDVAEFDLDVGDDLGSFRLGTGEPFTFDLATEKSVLIVASFTFFFTFSAERPYIFRTSCAVVPSEPPPDLVGMSFRGPRSSGRVPAFAEEANIPLEATSNWNGVIARPAGTISLVPQAQISGEVGGAGGEGSMISATCRSEIDIVIGTFSDDECLDWSNIG